MHLTKNAVSELGNRAIELFQSEEQIKEFETQMNKASWTCETIYKVQTHM